MSESIEARAIALIAEAEGPLASAIARQIKRTVPRYADVDFLEASPRLEVPDHPASYLMVRVESECPDQSSWSSAVDVYIRNSGRATVVGIDRADPR